MNVKDWIIKGGGIRVSNKYDVRYKISYDKGEQVCK